MEIAQLSTSLGILLIAGTHERAHYAFMMATAAASLGRKVVLFATNQGCRALAADWSSLDEVGRDAVIRRRGVTGLGELRDVAVELSIRLIACEAGLRAEGMQETALLGGVEVAGIATFLEAVGEGQMISL
jgi:predicted peroxiredoxin